MQMVVSANPMMPESDTGPSLNLFTNSHKRKRATVESLYDTSQAQSSVLERAQEVEVSLDPKFPSLLKVMLPSHVTGGFWLGLPKKFCCEHLPKQDIMIALEDENGEEFETKYLADKVGLSGGWRGFSIAHKLLEGDVIVFHLVTPSKFKIDARKAIVTVKMTSRDGARILSVWQGTYKGARATSGLRVALDDENVYPAVRRKMVYIVRSNGLDELDGAIGLMRLDACKKMDTGDTTACEREESETLEPISEDNAIAFNTKSCPISDHSESESEDDVGFEVLDGLRLSESVVTFEEVKCMDDFNVLVNGLIINSEFSKYILNKYYELCCSQNSFLHEHLLEGLNCKLVAGVISETVNIADAIRACNITTPEGNFSTWDQTLKAFQGLGMNIGFLLARLDQLVSLASKSKRFKEARLEKDQAEEEMRCLEAKLLEVKEAVNRLESEIETLNTSSENPELVFQEVAKSSW
ncbi:AP2/B3-like transcriptional factor family protein [Prunus dulcis]|uniref:AP2/B3-like transcriptional factor family protein n=1 Tax=Prunus dulcis TaxID=3755 RepID=A0A4Y1S0N5_PRUDU|nr:AP2/B3-like transcriptional factor family protein [Prunus dulcis]